MRDFSGWPSKNIHTDEEFAKACGLPSPIASGTMSEAYLVELMLDVFGEDWIRHGRMELTFIRMVQPGDVLIAKGQTQKWEGTALDAGVTLQVWCENQRGEHVVIGTAWGRLKSPAGNEGGSNDTA